jgi:hypothetical protein
MKTQTKSILARLSTARRWLELFEADYEYGTEEQSEQDAAATETLIKFTKTYRKELIHSAGLAVRYENDFERYIALKEAASEADTVLEYMKALPGAERPPNEAMALVQWIFGAVLDMVIMMNTLEGNNPDFPAMRAEYESFVKEHIQV